MRLYPKKFLLPFIFFVIVGGNPGFSGLSDTDEKDKTQRNAQSKKNDLGFEQQIDSAIFERIGPGGDVFSLSKHDINNINEDLLYLGVNIEEKTQQRIENLKKIDVFDLEAKETPNANEFKGPDSEQHKAKEDTAKVLRELQLEIDKQIWKKAEERENGLQGVTKGDCKKIRNVLEQTAKDMQAKYPGLEDLSRFISLEAVRRRVEDIGDGVNLDLISDLQPQTGRENLGVLSENNKKNNSPDLEQDVFLADFMASSEDPVMELNKIISSAIWHRVEEKRGDIFSLGNRDVKRISATLLPIALQMQRRNPGGGDLLVYVSEDEIKGKIAEFKGWSSLDECTGKTGEGVLEIGDVGDTFVSDVPDCADDEQVRRLKERDAALREEVRQKRIERMENEEKSLLDQIKTLKDEEQKDLEDQVTEQIKIRRDNFLEKIEKEKALKLAKEDWLSRSEKRVSTIEKLESEASQLSIRILEKKEALKKIRE